MRESCFSTESAVSAAASAVAMALCGLLIKKCGWTWLETYAMSISMLVGMVAAVVLAPLVGYVPASL